MTEEAKVQPPIFTEIIPAQPGQVSAIGSLGAPFIYTDWIGSQGHNGGAVVNITLEAQRHMLVDGKSVSDRVVVAHLRMPVGTMRALKVAIEQVELLMKPVASTEKN